MTQQDKDLLLRDLCARLPYGVKIPFRNNSEILLGIKCDYCYTESNTPISTDGVKPFLRPLSSMTKEEKNKYEEIAHNSFDGTWFSTIEPFDYLNSIHVDYRGLIEKGLAIEVTEENNPYK